MNTHMKGMVRTGLILTFAWTGLQAMAQTSEDSLTIVSAKWQEQVIAKGVKGRCAAFESLYGGPQYVSIVEVKPRRKHRADIGVSRQMRPISELARAHQAVAAINGSYYNMKVGNSVCFLKVDSEVLDTTTQNELDARVTGAVSVRRGKMKIQPWSKEIERNYRKKKGSILASGPLMLSKGDYADWSVCEKSFITTKHPRSAIVLTKNHRVLLVTVDGRAKGNAIGMSIPELAHLTKMLDGKTALNLDGGGSTMLYLDGQILNHPCDNKQFDHAGERHIPNIIYFK